MFQILEQNENLTRFNEFIASNGVKILTSSRPQIHDFGKANLLHIYLRGIISSDNYDVSSINFESNKKRDEYFNYIQQALKEWSDSIRGNGENKSGVYELWVQNVVTQKRKEVKTGR